VCAQGGGGEGEYEVGGGAGNGGYFFDSLLFISPFPSFQVLESLALPPTPRAEGLGIRGKVFVVGFVPARSTTQRLYQPQCPPAVNQNDIQDIKKAFVLLLTTGACKYPQTAASPD